VRQKFAPDSDAAVAHNDLHVLIAPGEAGAISADAGIAQAAMDSISLMAKGDATAVKSLLRHYVVVTPAIRDVLARLGRAPPQQRPIYSTADHLGPVAHLVCR
jgi:hypothetical protein